jgi:GTPase
VAVMMLDASRGFNADMDLRPIRPGRGGGGGGGDDGAVPREVAETAALFARDMVTTDDLRVAEKVVREGRPLVVVPNKWDALTPLQRQYAEIGIKAALEGALHQVRGLPVVPVSALTGDGVENVSPAVVQLHARWNERVKTNTLNQFLAHLTSYQPPPRVKGKPIKLRFISQTNVRPPTFAVRCSRASAVPGHYSAFLLNSIREEFGFQGVPLRLSIVKGENPYAGSGPRPRR